MQCTMRDYRLRMDIWAKLRWELEIRGLRYGLYAYALCDGHILFYFISFAKEDAQINMLTNLN